MSNITVYYPHNALMANRDVSFSVNEGEIHALVGENGAGKTTLMKVLYGLVSPREGIIRIRGEEKQIKTPLQATALNIGFVQQRFTLIPDFSVSQNVTLGCEPRRGKFFNDPNAAESRVETLIREHHFFLDPRAPVASLSVGQQQQVEILKLLYREAELLILDEPTAVLTDRETEGLFRTLRELRSRGKTIILITHKLKEVMDISDRVSVMRRGEMVAVCPTSQTDRRQLTGLMVGKPSLFEIHKEKFEPGRVVFSLENLHLLEKQRSKPLLQNISFSVREGEIVGLTAIAGNGLAELEDVISGMRNPTAGRILLDGRELKNECPREEWRTLVPYVPGDRLYRGSSLSSSLSENLIVSGRNVFFNSLGFSRPGRIRDFSERMIAEYGIAGSGRQPVEALSGGNIQKAVLAREISRAKGFILFAEPAWGLDVASSSFIYNRILELRKNGAAIVLLSSNLDEILGLADTLLILFHGKITGKLDNNPKISKDLAGEYMLGLRDDFSVDTGGAG